MSKNAPTDSEIQAAKDILRKDYWHSVRSYAQEIYLRKTVGDLKDNEEGAFETLHQLIDGSEWIIYTHNNLQVLCWTDNDDAAYDACGEDVLNNAANPSHAYQVLAYHALRADVERLLAVFEKYPPTKEEVES